MFDVCYSGKEKSFDTAEQAMDFCDELMEQDVGSDIWVGAELYKSYVYDMLTDTFTIEP